MLDIKEDLINKVNEVVKIISDYSKRVDIFERTIQDLELRKKGILKEISVLEEKTKQARDENSIANAELKKKSQEAEYVVNVYTSKVSSVEKKEKLLEEMRIDLEKQRSMCDSIVSSYKDKDRKIQEELSRAEKFKIDAEKVLADYKEKYRISNIEERERKVNEDTANAKEKVNLAKKMSEDNLKLLEKSEFLKKEANDVLVNANKKELALTKIKEEIELSKKELTSQELDIEKRLKEVELAELRLNKSKKDNETFRNVK